jgi:hypothetical protein
VRSLTAVEPYLHTFLAGNNPKTVVLNLVKPLAAVGQFCGFDRKARRDEPGREGTLQHADLIKVRHVSVDELVNL